MTKLVFKSTDIEPQRSKFTDEAFYTMKAQFPDEPDESIARFLIARNGDVSKAVPFLKKSIAWRAEKLPVKVPTFYKEFLKGKIYLHGKDLTNHSLVVYRGRLNFAKEREIDQMLNMFVWWMEQAIKALPEDKSQITFLFDRTGSTGDNVDIDFIKALAGVMQDNYPERLHKIIVHPVGILFYGGWSIAKWFIEKKTQEKVHPMIYLSGVQQFISDEFIPNYMGGNCEYAFSGAELQDPFVGKTPEEIALMTTPPKATATTSDSTATSSTASSTAAATDAVDHAAIAAFSASMANTPADVAPDAGDSSAAVEVERFSADVSQAVDGSVPAGKEGMDTEHITLAEKDDKLKATAQ